MSQESDKQVCVHPENQRVQWSGYHYSCRACGATPSEILLEKTLQGITS
jgi:hypothetical protein